MPSDVSGGLGFQLLQLAGSALIGFVAALGTFRARFVALERDVAAAKILEDERRGSVLLELSRMRDEFRQTIGVTNRRQVVTLELVADMANKAGVNNRFADLLPRLLAEESTDG